MDARELTVQERALLLAVAGIEAAGGVAHAQAVTQNSPLRADEVGRLARRLTGRGYLVREYADRADQRAETLGPRYRLTDAGRRAAESAPR